MMIPSAPPMNVYTSADKQDRRAREHLTQNLSIDRDDFDTIPLLHRNAAVPPETEERPMSDTRRFTAVIYREDGDYVALCPELDVASQGASVEEASANLREAVELFLESAAPSEVAARMHQEVYVAALEVRAG